MQFSKETQGTKCSRVHEGVSAPARSHQPDDHDVLIGWLLNEKIVSVVDRTADESLHFAHNMSVKTNSFGVSEIAHAVVLCSSRCLEINFRHLKGEV